MTPLPCPRCASPAVSGRFCTTCGAPLPVAEQDVAPAPATASAPAGTAPLSAAQLGSSPLGIPHQAAPPWLSADPAPVVRRSRTNGLALLVVAALVVSGWAIARGVEQHTLTGSVLLLDSSDMDLEPGDECFGEGGYDDVNDGAQVVVADEEGTTLSTGRLSAGEFDGLGCVFSFELEDVTRAEFYALNVAGENRGELQYSYDELADDDWSVELTLGGD